jgi:hypothetical protein
LDTGNPADIKAFVQHLPKVIREVSRALINPTLGIHSAEEVTAEANTQEFLFQERRSREIKGLLNFFKDSDKLISVAKSQRYFATLLWYERDSYNESMDLLDAFFEEIVYFCTNRKAGDHALQAVSRDNTFRQGLIGFVKKNLVGNVKFFRGLLKNAIKHWLNLEYYRPDRIASRIPEAIAILMTLAPTSKEKEYAIAKLTEAFERWKKEANLEQTLSLKKHKKAIERAEKMLEKARKQV